MKHALFLADPATHVNQHVALGLAGELQAQAPWAVRMHPGVSTLRDLRRVLCVAKPDALVLHVGQLNARVTRFVADMTIPRVCVTADWQSALPVPVIVPDDDAIGRMAAEHLLGLGFEHFASLCYASSTAKPRMDAFAREIGSARKPIANFVLLSDEDVDHPFHAPHSESELIKWLRRIPKPCAVFVHSDNLGAHFIGICAAHGLRVPEDIAVLGVDDDPLFCQTIFPNLSSVRVPHTQAGRQAARLILDWQPGRRIVTIPPTRVMERDSIRAVSPSDTLVGMALDYLSASAGKRVCVRDLQQLTGLSAQMLVYRFRKAIGCSPMEEILRQRINHARHLLEKTDLPVSTVTRQCGFNSANGFYVTFRKLVGTSPRDYRHEFEM